MAYNRKNRLQRIIDIQKIYLEKQAEGVSIQNIYLLYIKPVYRISERAFYYYMDTNAKKELKEIEQIEKAQLSFF